MRRTVKILIGVMAGLASFISAVYSVVMIRMSSQVNSFNTTPIDMTSVADGVYEGHSETDLV